MKKISAIIAAAAFTATLVSCAGEKTGTAPSKPDEPKTTAAATEETSENVTTKKTTAITTTVKTTTTTQPDPLGGGSFEYNEDGAVVFKTDFKDADDRTMLSAAQALFESACRTQWNFTVGCPFKIDEQFIETGNFNWRYYHISDSNIKTFSDVENAYHKHLSQTTIIITPQPQQLSQIITAALLQVTAIQSSLTRRSHTALSVKTTE